VSGRAQRVGFALAGLLVLGLALMLATAPGLRLLWAGLSRLLPEEVQVSAVSGRLLGPLRLEGVRYTTATLDVRIGSLGLEWHPAALLRGYVDIERVAITGVEVTRLAEDEIPMVLPTRIELPMAVYVGRLSLEPVSYRAGPEAAPVVVDRLSASLRLVSGVLAVSGLRVRAPQGSARGELRLETSGTYPLSAGLTLDLAVEGLAKARGRLELGGDLGRLRLGLELEAPYRISAEAALDDPLNALSYDLHMEARGSRLAQIASGWPALSVTASIHARGDPAHADLAGWTRTTIEGVGPVRARLEAARLSAGWLRIGRLELEAVGTPGRLDFSGELGLSGPERQIQGRVHWQDLQWPVRGEAQLSSRQGEARIEGPLARPTASFDLALGPRGTIQGEVRVPEAGRMALEASWRDLAWPEQAPGVHSPSGRLHLSGALDNYTLGAEAELRHGPGWEGSLSLSGRGDRKGLRLHGVDLRTAHGRLGGQGAVAWDPELRLEVGLQGENLDPGTLVADWPGKLGIALALRARRQGGQWVGSLQHLEVAGELRGYVVKGTVKGRLDPAGALAGDLELSSGKSTIDLKAHLDARELGLSWKVDSPDLAALWPGAGGRLQGRGRIEGPRATPRAEASLSARAAHLAAYRVGELDLEADVDLSDRRSSTIRGHARDVAEPRGRLDEVTLEARGRMAGHRISLEAQAPQGALKLGLEGALSDKSWRFRLTRGRISPRELRPWVLERPAAGRIGRDGQTLELSRSCWRSEPARLCLEGARDTQGEHGVVELTELPLDALSPWLAARPSSRGR